MDEPIYKMPKNAIVSVDWGLGEDSTFIARHNEDGTVTILRDPSELPKVTPYICRMYGIPPAILFGDPSKATSESEMKIYYDHIERIQRSHFIDPVARYVALVRRARFVARRRVRRPARFSANGGR